MFHVKQSNITRRDNPRFGCVCDALLNSQRLNEGKMTSDEYANVLETILFDSLDCETIAECTFKMLRESERIELAQWILTDYDISFPNRDDENE